MDAWCGIVVSEHERSGGPAPSPVLGTPVPPAQWVTQTGMSVEPHEVPEPSPPPPALPQLARPGEWLGEQRQGVSLQASGGPEEADTGARASPA